MKKRIARKLKDNKPGIARRVVAAAAVLALLSFGFAGVAQNPSVLANIPLIGAALEEYVDFSKPDLEDYKVVIGKTVEDKGKEAVEQATGKPVIDMLIYLPVRGEILKMQ